MLLFSFLDLVIPNVEAYFNTENIPENESRIVK